MAIWLHGQVLRAIDVSETQRRRVESPPLGFGDSYDIQGDDDWAQGALTCFDRVCAALKQRLPSQR